MKTYRIRGIGLEIMSEDIGFFNMPDVIREAKEFGIEWRLPTLEEIRYLYELNDKYGHIMNFQPTNISRWYWIINRGTNNVFDFVTGVMGVGHSEVEHRARLVRDI